MGKDDKMAEYLCETCKHRRGKLSPWHTYEDRGIEYSYTGVLKVNCTESKKHPGMVKDAVRDVDCCVGYKKRKGK